jgi:hypothetical protein
MRRTVGLLFLGLTACSAGHRGATLRSLGQGAQGDTAAIQNCQAYLQDFATRRPKVAAAEQPVVNAAYTAPIGQVNQWRAGRQPHGPRMDWGDLSSTTPETVCFLDANFFDESTPPGDTDVINREIVIIDPSGNATVDSYGPQGRIPVGRPTPGVVWPGG